MAYRLMPEAGFLRECFEYDRDNGILRWKRRPREFFTSDQAFKMTNVWLPGLAAGSLRQGKGYLEVQLSLPLDGRHNFKVHRIIWKIETGDDPGRFAVDHINRKRTDNRFVNLRLLNTQENCLNNHRNVGLPKGVRRGRPGRDEFFASVALGSFRTAAAASAAYEEALSLIRGASLRDDPRAV